MATVIQMHSRAGVPFAAPAAPLDPIQLHAEAHNALSMALHYLRLADGENLPGATRKTVQALSALNKLQRGRA